MGTRRTFLQSFVALVACAREIPRPWSQLPGSVESSRAKAAIKDDRPKEEHPPPDAGASVIGNRFSKGLETELRIKVEFLSQATTDLRDRIKTTDFSHLLPVALLKKAKEVEKLARTVKNLLKS